MNNHDEFEGHDMDNNEGGELLDFPTQEGEVVETAPPKRGRGRPKKQQKALPNEAAMSNELKETMYKLRKKLPESVVDELDEMNLEQLKARIVQSDVNIHESEKARRNDEELESMKLELKEANAPYRDAVKHQKLIIAYSACLMDVMGET